MKRIVALCVCLLLSVSLLCACDGSTENEVSVDINAPIHVLEDFPKGNVTCLVTVESKGFQTATGADGTAVEPDTYVFKGQEAVDLYNLMNRSAWVAGEEAARPTGTFEQMLTLDFYSGKSVEDATAYFGSFTISNRDQVLASPSPMTLSVSGAQAVDGTYDVLWKYVTEKGEAEK